METGLTLAHQPSIVSIPEILPPSLEPGIALALRPVRILENRNPFRPDERRLTEIDPLDNESVGAIVTRAGMQPDEFAISVNGNSLPAEEIWNTAIMPGQEIVLFPKAGGGFLRQIAPMITMLVLSYVLGPTVLGLYPWMASAIAIGGAILVSWALSPGPASQATYSSTYDPTGPKGLAQAGTPVPKFYGKMGWCGNVISSYVSFAGQKAYINVLVCYGWGLASNITNPLINKKPVSDFFDLTYQTRLGSNSQTAIDGFNRTVNGYPQEIDMLVANGPIVVTGTGTDVQGLEITVKFPGGLYSVTNKGNYVTAHFVYKIEYAASGTNNWIAPLWPDQAHMSSIGTDNPNGTVSWPTWNVVPTDRFAGSGLVYAYDSGSHTAGDRWSKTETVTITNLDGSTSTTSATFTGAWERVDSNLDPVLCTQWLEGYCAVSADTISALFDTQCIYGLTAGKWDVRVTKIGWYQDAHGINYTDSNSAQQVSDGWLWNINEVTLSNLTYPNMVLVGLKGLATSQLSGLDIQVQSTIQHGIGADTVLPAALTSYGYDNPAVVAYDLLTNPTYGMGVSASNIDVPAFAAWAAFNDELVTNQDGTQVRRHIFNGGFDQSGDAWSALRTICSMSRAVPVPLGTRYSVALDAPGDPVQLFTVGNIKKGSFQESWLSLDDRCTLLEVEFADAARNYRMDLPVSVMTAADLNSGLAPKTTRTRLIGCTSRDQAWRWAYFHLLSTKLSLRTVQFTAPVEAVCCAFGSIIALQTDVTQWATGGRVQPGSTLSTLNVERPDITFSSGAGWTVSVQHPVVQRGTATILAVSNLTITMTAALPTGRILKLVGPDGTEYIVTGTSTSGATLAYNTGTLAAGQVVTLYDVNVIDNSAVSNVAITPAGPAGQGSAVITVSSPFSAVPTSDSSWAYGQSSGSQPAKLFRVGSIKKSGDFNLEISAVEYNASLYVDPIPAYGEIVGVPNDTAVIANLTLTEQFQNGTLTGSADSSVIAVGWQNQNSAVGANVQVMASSVSSGPTSSPVWQNLGNITGQGCTFVGTLGITYIVQATPMDAKGNSGTSITATITVVASQNAPANVSNFYAQLVGSNTVLKWTAVNPTPDHYEIRYSPDANTPDWDTASVLWDGSGTTWSDGTTGRPGLYMIVAVGPLAAGSVQSVTPSTCSCPPVITYANIFSNVSLPVSPTVVATGLSWSVNAPSSSTIFNIEGALEIVSPTSSSFQVAFALYLDGVAIPSMDGNTWPTRTFLGVASGSVASWPFFYFLSGLTPGTHTLALYGEASISGVQLAQVSYVQTYTG